MKNSFRSLAATAVAVTGLGILASAVVGHAKADTWDKTTYVTLNEPMIAGDMVLEPGTYVWKLLDSQSDRHIVQIFNKDQSHLEQTILAIPNYRLQPTGNTRFAFWETPNGVPKAVRAWFYPGDNFGQEFKYPKKLVAQLAAALPVPVSAVYGEHEPTTAATEAGSAVQPATAVSGSAPAAAEQAAASREQTPTEPASLPHTASSLPLIGILGLLSMGLAGVFSLRAKHS